MAKSDCWRLAGLAGLFVAVTISATPALLRAEEKPDPAAAALFDGNKGAPVAKDSDAVTGRCLAADVSALSGTIFVSRIELPGGAYRASIRVKLPIVNNINTAPLNWTLEVRRGDAVLGQQDFSMLSIERPGVYQEIACPFNLDRTATITCDLTWKRVGLSPKSSGATRVEQKDIPKQPDMGGLEKAPRKMSDDDMDIMLSEEPKLSSMKGIYFAVADLKMDRLGDLALERLEMDKIRYNAGERPTVSLGIRNDSPRAHQVTIKTELVQDLDTVIPVDERTASLKGGELLAFDCQGPPLTGLWGYAVRSRVSEDGRVLAEKEDYFTVHDNFWAVALGGRKPAQFTASITSREMAAASARENQRAYANWEESGFWAPDEFGGFTSAREHWWGGQGCYYESVTGTKLMTQEGHKRGISFAVYSNIWGGDGPPAFEWMRRHPDWGYPAHFNTEWFERWNRNPAGTGKPGSAMHVWPVTIIDYSKREAFEHHARELIAAHDTLGWDAVRYDSHAISEGNARVMTIVKATVRAKVPGFRFGYNSSVPTGRPIPPADLDAFRNECEGGGGIMEEGIREFGAGGLSFAGGATYEAFARRLLDFKEVARRNGGHFMAVGLDECFPNDFVYESILWFAGNTHTAYPAAPPSGAANYPQFATRFAGQLWDLNVAPLAEPAKWVDYGESAKNLWLWKDFVHQRDMGGGRRQLILHLINAPVADHLMTGDDDRLPPPRENLTVTIKLPGTPGTAGTPGTPGTGTPTVRGVWLATPETQLTQTKLKYELADGTLRLSVPHLRFWTMVVVDLDNAAEFK